jgi:hypothetical protein
LPAQGPAPGARELAEVAAEHVDGRGIEPAEHSFGTRDLERQPLGTAEPHQHRQRDQSRGGGHRERNHGRGAPRAAGQGPDHREQDGRARERQGPHVPGRLGEDGTPARDRENDEEDGDREAEAAEAGEDAFQREGTFS